MFADILSAMRYAYTVYREERVSKVIVYLWTNVTHYITPADYERVYPLVFENSLLDQNYSLTIL